MKERGPADLEDFLPQHHALGTRQGVACVGDKSLHVLGGGPSCRCSLTLHLFTPGGHLHCLQLVSFAKFGEFSAIIS